jgi:aryl-alcohol dehydrogenase-like predicted oxidoreductase
VQGALCTNLDMQYQQLGRTDLTVSRIGFGAWAIGGDWGSVDDEQSMAAMHAAIDAGVNFIDTADVYGDGRSERLVARLRRERPGETIHVATKAGRRLPEQVVEGYSRTNLTEWINRSLRNLETESIDLLQLHCPPSALYQSAVERLRPLVPQGLSLTQFALRWILMSDAVTTAIPGAKTSAQAKENASAGSLDAIDRDRMAAIEAIYNELIRTAIHSRW